MVAGNRWEDERTATVQVRGNVGSLRRLASSMTAPDGGDVLEIPFYDLRWLARQIASTGLGAPRCCRRRTW